MPQQGQNSPAYGLTHNVSVNPRHGYGSAHNNAPLMQQHGYGQPPSSGCYPQQHTRAQQLPYPPQPYLQQQLPLQDAAAHQAALYQPYQQLQLQGAGVPQAGLYQPYQQLQPQSIGVLQALPLQLPQQQQLLHGSTLPQTALYYQTYQAPVQQPHLAPLQPSTPLPGVSDNLQLNPNTFVSGVEGSADGGLQRVSRQLRRSINQAVDNATTPRGHRGGQSSSAPRLARSDDTGRVTRPTASSDRPAPLIDRMTRDGQPLPRQGLHRPKGRGR
jgi:hypothetical protein